MASQRPASPRTLAVQKVLGGTKMQREQNTEMANESLRNVQAVILCGGAGTRLQEVMPGTPKALAPVAGNPFLDYVLRHLMTAGVRQAVLCIGVYGDAVKAHYRASAWKRFSLRFSEECEALGTGGALKHAEKWIQGEPFLLLNGDTFLELDLISFVAQHLRTAASLTMALAEVKNAARYGEVQLDARGRVAKFVGKRAAAGNGQESGTSLVNAGWYAVNKEILKKMPAAPPALSFESQVLPKCVGNGLYGYRTDGFFIDIGVPEDFRRAQMEMMSGRRSLASANPR
jgi:D-glycero-alpha-D-manno-heptose 1-phosphate guanylyltransferase